MGFWVCKENTSALCLHVIVRQDVKVEVMVKITQLKYSRYVMDIFIKWKNTACHARNWNGVQPVTGEVVHYVIWNQDEGTNGRWRKLLEMETWCRETLKGKTLEEQEEDSELIDDWLVGCWLITRPNQCLIGH